MKIHIILFSIFIVLNLTACTSSEEKQAEAQAEFTEEKTETLREYKKCVKDSAEDDSKMAQCEALLKAVEVLEGGK